MTLYDYLAWGCWLFLMSLPWTLPYLPGKNK